MELFLLRLHKRTRTYFSVSMHCCKQLIAISFVIVWLALRATGDDQIGECSNQFIDNCGRQRPLRLEEMDLKQCCLWYYYIECHVDVSRRHCRERMDEWRKKLFALENNTNSKFQCTKFSPLEEPCARLTGGAIAGITVGSVLGVTCFAGLAWGLYLMCRP